MTANGLNDSGTEYHYAAEERPLFPGSPYSPRHSVGYQVGYGLVALVLGICATLGNGLVTTNISSLAGSLYLYASDASWFSAVYVAFNATANLTLIKARIQFGIPEVTRVLLLAYAGCAVLQVMAPDGSFAAALLVRAACGLAAAGLTTLTIYYLMQTMPAKIRPAALALGIVIPQFGSPLARLFPVEVLAISSWHGLALTEIAIALVALLAISLLPLPPSDRSRAFEPLDLVTITLILPAVVLLCGVLAQGRALWWTDTPWLGWSLSASTILLATAVCIERTRRNPLLQIGWIGSAGIARFALVALLVRMALAEQTFGAIGLLSGSGLNNDQLHMLFLIVLAAMAIGGVTAVATLAVPRLPYQVMAAALIIAAGALLDSRTNIVTGPEQLYLSQALIGFGTALFMGPALVYGFSQMVQRGPAFLVSFVVLFSTTQNIGSLLGSALLGTVQTFATRLHTQSLMSHLLVGDAQVSAAFRGAAPPGSLLAREASVLAYNDVFALVAALAMLVALYVAYLIIINWRK